MVGKEEVGVAGKVVASGLAMSVAAFVGSEMLQEVARTNRDRSLFSSVCLVMFFGVWACWEMLQIRQHLGLVAEMGSDGDN